MYLRTCVCAPSYLMTNRIEGSEQSGLNDYYGNEGERRTESGREGKSQITGSANSCNTKDTASVSNHIGLLVSFCFRYQTC